MEVLVTRYSTLKTPVGNLVLVSQDEGPAEVLVAAVFQRNWNLFKQTLSGPRVWRKGSAGSEVLPRASKQLREYFHGKRTHFELPLSVEGTEFQRMAWTTLREIPYGKLVSYQEQARMMKKPKAVRAVGSANRVNRFCIIVPCHRVVGKDGSMSGYAGGTSAKKWLIDLERRSGSVTPP